MPKQSKRKGNLQGARLRSAMLNVACWHHDESVCKQTLSEYVDKHDWHEQDEEGMKLALIVQRFVVRADWSKYLQDKEMQIEIEALRKSLHE